MVGKQKYKKQLKFNSKLVIFVVMILCCITFFRTKELKEKSSELQEQETKLEQEIDQQNGIAQSLIEQQTYMQSKKYIEEMAKNKLGLVYEDEIIIKPQEEDK